MRQLGVCFQSSIKFSRLFSRIPSLVLTGGWDLKMLVIFGRFLIFALTLISTLAVAQATPHCYQGTDPRFPYPYEIVAVERLPVWSEPDRYAHPICHFVRGDAVYFRRADCRGGWCVLDATDEDGRRSFGFFPLAIETTALPAGGPPCPLPPDPPASAPPACCCPR